MPRQLLATHIECFIHLFITMSTTTQNEWEKEHGIVTMAFMGKTWFEEESAKRFYLKKVADARKEECRQRLFTIDGLKKTCGICGVIKETAFHKDASQSHDGCENNYNKAIDDVLATLRKESK